MSEVRLESVSKRYGSYTAVNEVSLTVRDGEFLTILGPSGCGKTTTLRMVAGFVSPDSGAVYIGQANVSHVPAYRRNTGMVFQSYALFPHLTVEENIAYGLQIRKTPKSEIRQRVEDALDLVQLSQLAGRYPRELSGGQQQRVALARAVVISPDILLLDEPIAALDLKLRQDLQIEIKRVQESLGITTLFVTHDQGEALSLSDRVAVMNGGQILQLDTPRSLYNHPNCGFVANFIGKTNTLDVNVVEGPGSEGLYTVRSVANPNEVFRVAHAPNAVRLNVGSDCLLAFRPERAAFGDDRPNRMTAKVEKMTYYGSAWSISATNRNGEAVTIEQASGIDVPLLDAEVMVTWSPHDCFLLPKDQAHQSQPESSST